jgi:hypothetical protein
MLLIETPTVAVVHQLDALNPSSKSPPVGETLFAIYTDMCGLLISLFIQAALMSFISIALNVVIVADIVEEHAQCQHVESAVATEIEAVESLESPKLSKAQHRVSKIPVPTIFVADILAKQAKSMPVVKRSPVAKSVGRTVIAKESFAKFTCGISRMNSPNKLNGIAQRSALPVQHTVKPSVRRPTTFALPNAESLADARVEKAKSSFYKKLSHSTWPSSYLAFGARCQKE